MKDREKSKKQLITELSPPIPDESGIVSAVELPLSEDMPQ